MGGGQGTYIQNFGKVAFRLILPPPAPRRISLQGFGIELVVLELLFQGQKITALKC